ncbi:MAG: hypothetical protein GXP31_13650 [Kiritimatiellaeota bacterium]|nr:hypothetical protein [Kiritimatiellota bacterium]
MRLELKESYVAMDFEAENEERTLAKSLRSVTRERWLLVPRLGLDARGSVYHPNLLGFGMALELGADREHLALDSADQAYDSTGFLQRYHATLTLLRKKPYATFLSADKDVSFRQSDFFHRGEVNSQRFGMTTGYRAGPVPITFSGSHLEEQVTGLTRLSQRVQDVFTVTASNKRDRGHTEVSYRWEQYAQDEPDYVQNGVNHDASLSDVEYFDSAQEKRLISTLLWSRLSTAPSSFRTESLHVTERLDLEHTPSFATFYDYSFSANTTGLANTTTHSGRLGVRHQLYDNLQSTADLHADNVRAIGPGSRLATARFGGRVNEAYTRHLGGWGLLTFNCGFQLDSEKRDSSGGELFIVDERHTLRDDVPTFLAQPEVVAVTAVTDSSGTFHYRQGLDYYLVSRGTFTELRRIPGGTIPNGGAVLVDYTAAAQASAAYDTMITGANLRIDFWERRLGLYGRVNLTDTFGDTHLLVDSETTETVIGVDTDWSWLRAGAELIDHDSDLVPYRSLRLYESFAFAPSSRSALGLDLTQTRTMYPDRDQITYGFIGRYRQRFSACFTGNIEGGKSIERGEGFDQDVTTARFAFDLTYAQLAVNFGYEFANETLYGEKRIRHFLFLRVKRNF